jgi:hypothetical protein
VHVLVDNSAGADDRFADEILGGLRERGLDADLRAPATTSIYDTGVHIVASGIGIRVSERPERAELALIEEVVRAALEHRGSLRRRTRAVPVYLGDTARVLEWIDVFD